MNGNTTNAISAFKAAQHKNLLKICQEKVRNGITKDDLIVFLHTQRLDLDTAIQFFRNSFGGLFWEAAHLFKNHNEWREDVENTEMLTSDFLDCFDEENDVSGNGSNL